MANVWEFDRSRHLDGLACKRKRYMSYHYRGTGIQKLRKSLALEFGSAFHEAAEDFLGGKGVESAVDRALNYLRERFETSGIDLEGDDLSPTAQRSMIQYSIAEQMAIAEGLIRGWWVKNGERFLEQFEVLEVEREGRAQLVDGVTLMFRPDALVRERSTGDIYIVSWKTASTFGSMTIRSIEHDMQSISEVWGVQQAPYKIEGTLYLFAVKGQRKMDDYLGFKTQDTPLAYGWVRQGATPEDSEWSWKYGWNTEEINAKTGKAVGTKLGKGFRKVLVSEHYPGGVKGWIDALAAQEITPRHINALEAAFPESMPIERRVDEIESWKRQTVGEELRWQDAIHRMDNADYGHEELMDELFPQSTARCWDYFSRCSMWETCFVPAIKADPIGSGLYQIRLANHPEKSNDGD